MSENKILVAGYSGHAYVVADSAISSGLDLIGYTSIQKSNINPYNLKYFGYERNNDFLNNYSGENFILGVGNNKVRSDLFTFLKNNNYSIMSVIDKSSNVCNNVRVGIGVFISKSVCINPLVTIGDACIINTSSVIEHNCFIGNYSHIGPGAVLCGNVMIGQNTFIGANSVIKQGVKIGNNVIVGAGSVIIKDISDNIKVVGNPSKEIR